MGFQNLLVETQGPLARVTINRTEKLNALNRATLQELDDVFRRLGEDPQVGAVILTGAGAKAFIAGADISELAQQSPLEGRRYALFGQAVFSRIETLGKPVLAAVNGYALGGGCEIALACTLRIASSSARFGQPEVNLGIIPGYGGTQRLARLVGRGQAPGVVLSRAESDPHQAHPVGLGQTLGFPGGHL